MFSNWKPVHQLVALEQEILDSPHSLRMTAVLLSTLLDGLLLPSAS